jgi:N-acetylglutamate synthase-like GNAT family acetyltransferase
MIFREAKREDVIEIVKMIANDKLGKLREDFKEPLPNRYYAAFENIENDKNQELIVLEDDDKEVIGTLQLSFIQYLTYQGGIRAQIEAVRIREDQRGKGVGEKMLVL